MEERIQGGISGFFPCVAPHCTPKHGKEKCYGKTLSESKSSCFCSTLTFPGVTSNTFIWLSLV